MNPIPPAARQTPGAETQDADVDSLLSAPCYCLAVRRASRRLGAIYDAELAAHGLTVSQFAIMTSIRTLSAPTVQRIADQMEMDQSALSRGLMPLERGGLVAAKSDPADRRKKILVLTEMGARRLQEATAAWETAQRQVEAGVHPDSPDLNTLLAGINALGRPADTM
ncbi:MarR family winged helix-turn-helix transcriptional regulator [Pseudooceanicola aestuarii]|uniref:MarR family winged helix-turn-helix transcriptional regulator n=1 Tax=Pseudooceanicola aestuarii TaxID=2697319 RepID=UPI0013D6D701|nr:MarR family transcriptional regulator [Pseudooceanicola aestuarii]